MEWECIQVDHERETQLALTTTYQVTALKKQFCVMILRVRHMEVLLSQFLERETEASKRKLTCSRSHNQFMAALGRQLKFLLESL